MVKDMKVCLSPSTMTNCAGKVIGFFFVVIVILIALYCALVYSPLHLVYDVAPPCGPATVYVPGGGFAGFWFHLGYLQSVPNLNDYDFYCFSSGCLAVLAALLNRTMDETAAAAFGAQNAWSGGQKSRFELVEHFFDDLVPLELEGKVDRVLGNLKILITTVNNGLEVKEASNRQQLKDLLIKTTWVPYLTGWGILSDEEDSYFDGGFSRLLHPECEVRLDLPLIWETIVHTFSPGLSHDQVRQLWRAGQRFDYVMPSKRRLHSRWQEVVAPSPVWNDAIPTKGLSR